jgi:glycosyltransferase involved in cell wall biosynthesis
MEKETLGTSSEVLILANQNLPQRSPERPLVSFVLFAYNQEQYIREAIEAAFSQTYSPLEIILSDDCSTDKTHEIMEEMAREYKGCHKVRVNQNSVNMGIAAHVHKIDMQANGVLIVHSAGDDISLPERTERLAQAWLSFEKPPSVIVSNALIINSDGTSDGATAVNATHPSCFLDGTQNKFHKVLGCSLSVSKDLFSVFDTIDERIIAEDVVLYRRAELLNGVYYLQQPLVKWRCHPASISHSPNMRDNGYLAWQKKWTHDELLRLTINEADRSKFGLTGHRYSPRYTRFIQLKKKALENGLLAASVALLASVLAREISLSNAKEILKIVIIRVRT